jgi:cation diffusion facilitator CzcD-associated flavoprotein CzcO
LASSRELTRAGIGHVVLERGETVGHTWVQLYDGLVLHTGKHLSALPGMPFPSSTPLFPSRDHFIDYLRQYAERFDVPVRTRAAVESIARSGEGWIVQLRDGRSMRSHAMVVATGIVSNPYVPEIPNRARFGGRVMHSVDYHRPEPFANQRVLVVGAGNSSGEICAELAGACAHVTVAIRSGARVVPRELLGIPVQYIGAVLDSLPPPVLRRAMRITSAVSDRFRGASPLPPPTDNPCAAVPLIGFHLTDGVKSGRIQLRRALREFTPEGVRFSDGEEQPFDTVMLATGYRAALGMLDSSVTLDRCGFGARRNRVISVDDSDLYFVGHNYGPAGGLRNIARDSHLAARLIAARLRDSGRRRRETPQRLNER